MTNTVHIRRRQTDPSLPLLQRIFHSRGLSSTEPAYALQGLADIHTLKGIDRACDLLVDAIEQDRRILVVGDFDVDGATSTTLAVDALQQFGAKHVSYLVPNRFEFGYGLTPEIVDYAHEHFNPEVIVTVDNGISSFSGVEKAQALGIKVVVTDHHLAAGPLASDLPTADAIVNPNQPGCEFPSKAACGCAVIFYVMCALRTRLESKGRSTNVNMAGYLDLVALATVADVVPLDENNRILVEQGLRRIRKGHGRPGIQALLQVSQKMPERLTSKDFGFALGPRLNAAGRLDDMTIGIECLLAQDVTRALHIAQTLDELNQDRKSVEAGMQQEALAQLEKINLNAAALPTALTLFNPQWHQGVVGLLASRLKDRFYRPVIAFAPANEGELEPHHELKGSGRSIAGFHLRDGLDLVAKRIPHVLQKFGGHAMAAGLSIQVQHLAEFERVFNEVVAEQLSAEDLHQVVITDGPLVAHEFTLDMAQQLRFVAPWGQQFPEPLFDGEFEIINQRIVGERHLKMTLREPASGMTLDAIAFNVDTKCWPNNSASHVHIVYELDANFFRNDWTLQLMVRHVSVSKVRLTHAF